MSTVRRLLHHFLVRSCVVTVPPWVVVALIHVLDFVCVFCMVGGAVITLGTWMYYLRKTQEEVFEFASAMAGDITARALSATYAGHGPAGDGRTDSHH